MDDPIESLRRTNEQIDNTLRGLANQLNVIEHIINTTPHSVAQMAAIGDSARLTDIYNDLVQQYIDNEQTIIQHTVFVDVENVEHERELNHAEGDGEENISPHP